MWPPCRYLDPSVGSAAAAAASPTGGPPGCVMVTEAHLTTLNPGVGPAQLAAVRDHLVADSNLWGRSVLPFVRRVVVCLFACCCCYGCRWMGLCLCTGSRIGRLQGYIELWEV
jgi:hypothetical protein